MFLTFQKTTRKAIIFWQLVVFLVFVHVSRDIVRICTNNWTGDNSLIATVINTVNNKARYYTTILQIYY